MFKHTDADVKAQFGSFEPDTVAVLLALPCAFAYEERPDGISLGPYRLDEFNAFYAAFIAVAAANDFLCYQWGTDFWDVSA